MDNNQEQSRAQHIAELGLLGIIARPRTQEGVTLMGSGRYASEEGSAPIAFYRVDSEGVAVAAEGGQTELFVSYSALADIAAALGVFDNDNQQEQQNG